TISGITGVFFMQETWDTVTVLNGADRPLLVKGPGGVAVNTLNGSISTTPEAVIGLSVDIGGGASEAPPWRFDVKHIFPATVLRIESIRGPPSATACAGSPCDMTIDGDIRNLIGSTTIRNDRGSILAGPDGTVETFFSNT